MECSVTSVEKSDIQSLLELNSVTKLMNLIK